MKYVARHDAATDRLNELEGWLRLAHVRLLVTNHATSPIEKISALLESPSELARLHALCTLHGINQRNGTSLPDALLARALQDPSPGVVENALLLAGDLAAVR